MRSDRASLLSAALRVAMVLVIVKIIVSVLLTLPDYVPPNFEADFLRGRDRYFWRGYHVSFFVHIFAGPLSLILGLMLMSRRFLRRFPKWHRKLGRIQGMNVLLMVAPSGLGMAPYALTGETAAVSFVVLSLLTGGTVVMGWMSAVQRRFEEHRRWMTRCFALLCSAVLIRVVGGVGDVFRYDADWVYRVSAWGCWIGPLLGTELMFMVKDRRRTTEGDVVKVSAIGFRRAET
ncbi:MAG: DUF2306 domain-containing protein [Planctomycetaceae bacterium]|nr:DUF2306 domain-containing protein [Planctomycetaceae bacterium]